MAPLKLQPPSGGLANGYVASLLVDIYTVGLLARDADVPTNQNLHLVQRCDELIRSFQHHAAVVAAFGPLECVGRCRSAFDRGEPEPFDDHSFK